MPHPKGVAVDEAANRIYVASRSTNSLYIINGATHGLIKQLAVGQLPWGVDVNPVTRRAYVANAGSGTVSVVNMDTMLVIQTINVGAGSEPVQVAVNRTTNRIYVALHTASQVKVIDGASNTVVATVNDIHSAFDVVVDEGQNIIFASERDAGYIAAINGVTNTEIYSLRTYPGGEPYALALDPVLKRLYVVFAPYSTLVLDRRGIPVSGYMPIVEADGLQKQSAGDPNKIAVFEVKPMGLGRYTTLTAGQAGADGGIGIAANPATGSLFVSNAAANSESVFDGQTLLNVATLPMPGNPGDIGINSILGRVYTSNRSANVVKMVLDTW